MRRMTCGTFALLALCALPAMAAADKMNFSIQGGASVPSGAFGGETELNARTGWSIGVSGDYAVHPSWAVGIDGSWNKNKNGFEGESTDLGGGFTSTIDEASFSTWQIGGHARYWIPTNNANPVRWYGILGAGIYGFGGDVTETVSSGSSSTTTSYSFTDKRAGMKLGLGGVYWAKPTLGINGGVDYHIAFLDKDTSTYSSLSYAGAYLGLTFSVPQSQ